MHSRFKVNQTSEAYAAVAIGGGIGGVVRAIITDIWPHTVGDVPLNLLFVNIFGSALLAIVLVVGERVLITTHSRHHLWRPFIATGVLGGFTTTSAFAGATAELIHFGDTELAFLFVGLSVVLSLVAFHFLQALTLRMIKPRVEK